VRGHRRRAGRGGRPAPPPALAGAGAVLVLAGSACERWAVYKAGFQSVRDPKYVVAPQRARLAERGGEQVER
jgi:hypothetical protein